ncbi:MAG: DUF116 domain-containing protein [Candidatus Caldarchaeales archaeon]
MPYRYRFDLTVLPKKFFKELMIIVDSKHLHKKAGTVLRGLVERFKLSEITGLEISNILQIIEDIVDIHIKNLTCMEKFKKSVRRALFLPHCARKYVDYRCKAEFDPRVPTYICGRCSPDCQINLASKMAEDIGYDVYIVPGGSCIPNIIKMFNYDGIVGVACGDEIKLASKYLDEGVSAQAIPLLKNGCSNTKFNLEYLRKILQLNGEHSMSSGKINFSQ